MTCIVAVTDGRAVVIGGDSAASAGQELRIRADPKVFVVGRHYAIGFTTSFRMGQILRFGTELPEPPTEVGTIDFDRFMVAEFVPAVRLAFAEHGFAKTAKLAPPGDAGVTEEGQEVGGLFLVGVAGQIFEIQRDYQIARPAVPYSAVGFGALIALGALHALESVGELSLKERAGKALAASEAYCTSVRRPFHFVELPALTDDQGDSSGRPSPLRADHDGNGASDMSSGTLAS
jgi:ATP-dependent protease HslVU (ClpYQ) peptidase subunit